MRTRLPEDWTLEHQVRRHSNIHIVYRDCGIQLTAVMHIAKYWEVEDSECVFTASVYGKLIMETPAPPP